MSEIFRKLDERAARERVRAERVRRVALTVAYVAVGLMMVWSGIGDLKGPAGDHGGRMAGVPIVAAFEFLAAGALAIAALLVSRAAADKSKWYMAVSGIMFFALVAGQAAGHDWRDLWFDGWAALLGLTVLASIIGALVPARERPAS
jgi:hypothetical protein